MIQSQSKAPDIFISYASDDRERVVPLAKALENCGWTVWWDRRIPPGKTFDEVIKEGLTKSKCVIVVWSEVSVESRWVKTEASIALKANKLVPVMIDRVEPPLEFLMIQAANLVQWQPGIDSEEFEQLVAAVGAITGEPRAPDEKEEAAAAQIESAGTSDRPAEKKTAGKPGSPPKEKPKKPSLAKPKLITTPKRLINFFDIEQDQYYERFIIIKNGGSGTLDWRYRSKGGFFSTERFTDRIKVYVYLEKIYEGGPRNGEIQITSNGGDAVINVQAFAIEKKPSKKKKAKPKPKKKVVTETPEQKSQETFKITPGKWRIEQNLFAKGRNLHSYMNSSSYDIELFDSGRFSGEYSGKISRKYPKGFSSSIDIIPRPYTPYSSSRVFGTWKFHSPVNCLILYFDGTTRSGMLRLNIYKKRMTNIYWARTDEGEEYFLKRKDD